MEKLFHLLSKADLSTVLLILLQNPTPAITFSFLFLSFIFLSTFFSLSTYKCGSFPLFLKQNRKHLTWFSLLLRLLFYFSPSLDTKILHRIDSLTNLACLPPHFFTTSLPHRICFLVTSSPTFRFCSHCCGETAHAEHINSFLIVKASDFLSSFGQLVGFTDKIQNSQLYALFGGTHTHTHVYKIIYIIYLKWTFNWASCIFIIKSEDFSNFPLF